MRRIDWEKDGKKLKGKTLKINDWAIKTYLILKDIDYYDTESFYSIATKDNVYHEKVEGGYIVPKKVTIGDGNVLENIRIKELMKLAGQYIRYYEVME